MSYSTLILEEGISWEFLAVLKPAVKVTSWTDQTGNIHTNSFSLGYVSGVTIDGTAQTLDTSSAVTSGKYYWDNDNSTLYIYSAGTGAQFIVVTYELYYGTKGAHFPRIPTSASSTTNIEVYYDPAIIKPASFKATLSDSLFGFLPSQSSNITIGNPDHLLEHLYDSSFNQKDILIYHWLDDLETANIKLLLDGKMQNISYNLTSVSINVLDKIDIFDSEYRNVDNSFYNTTDFPNVDSNYIGSPIRFVYGKADQIKLVDLDYNTTAPTTSNNRIWSVREGTAFAYTGTVPASPACTNTRTYVADASGVNVGDQVWLDKGTDEYRTITAVNRTGNNYMEHVALSSGAAAEADTVKKGTLGNLFIEQGGTSTACYYNRDYAESTSNNVVVITLTASAESNMSINTLTGSENVYGRIYGEQNSITKGGSGFGTDSTSWDTLTNPAVILFDILKSRVGITEAEMDLTSFTTLETEIGAQEIGFALPQGISEDFPRVKDIILKIMSTNLVQLFYNTDGKWEVDYVKALPSDDADIDKTEIVIGSIRYNISYTDIISEAIVNYDYKENNGLSSKQSTSSNNANYLHNVKKQKTFDTYLISSSDASTLADKLSYIFGEREGTFELNCKNRFFNNFISDTIEVSLEKHVGFTYTSGTENARSYEIIGIDKTSNTVKIKLNDQKGVQDNSGSF